jgi:hypothetical protein
MTARGPPPEEQIVGLLKVVVIGVATIALGAASPESLSSGSTKHGSSTKPPIGFGSQEASRLPVVGSKNRIGPSLW